MERMINGGQNGNFGACNSDRCDIYCPDLGKVVNGRSGLKGDRKIVAVDWEKVGLNCLSF